MKTALKILGGLAVVVLVCAAYYLWTPSGAPFDRDAALAKASDYDVTVYRDNWGVPHVYGRRDEDVAFGIGYAHSEDDWQTMQEVIAMTRGDLARYKGQSAGKTDYIVDLFRIHDLVEAKYDTEVPGDLKVVLQAYADGINLYGAEHADVTWAGLLPVGPKDLIKGYVFRMPFFYGMDEEIGKVFDPHSFEPTDIQAARDTVVPVDHPLGSNAFALAPSRSEEGVTRLLINSHQPFTGPVAWYEARLHSEEGWDIVGGLFPGTPFIGHGHTAHLGWASTVNKPDLVDIYKLTINPENENEYWLDGKWVPLEVSKSDFRVKLFGPFSLPIKREILRSEHGPVLRLPHGTFAIRYAGMDEVRQAEQFYRLNKAQDFEEWKSAMRMGAISSLNDMYADEKGNIAYLYNATFPKRVDGPNWRGLLPGDRSDLIWKSYEPFEAVPFLVNPKSGFIINANSSPFQATEPTSDLYEGDYPRKFGIDEGMTNRSLRALEHFADDPKISFEDFAAAKFDVQYSSRSDVKALMDYYLSLDAADDGELKAAQEVIAKWDLSADQENQYATLPVITSNLVLNWSHPITDDVKKVETLKEMAAQLKTKCGTLTPVWGDVNRLRRGTVDLPLDGGPDTLRAVYGGSDLDESCKLTAMAGDTLIYFVEWDATGQMHSESIHQFGSATLDKSSPHYADQALLFAKERMKPTLFDFADLEPMIERAYRPGEASVER